jgi:hypothetical protein
MSRALRLAKRIRYSQAKKLGMRHRAKRHGRDEYMWYTARMVLVLISQLYADIDLFCEA